MFIGSKSLSHDCSLLNKDNESIEEVLPSEKIASEKSDIAIVKPNLTSRLSEKFFAPSQTPDNGKHHVDEYCEKLDRSPWSFSGDSLMLQTPRAHPDVSNVLSKVFVFLLRVR